MTEDDKAVEAGAAADKMLRAFVDTEAGQGGCWALIKEKEPAQAATMMHAMLAAIAAYKAHLEAEGMVVVPEPLLNAAVKRAVYDRQEAYVQADPTHFHNKRREVIFELARNIEPYDETVGFGQAKSAKS